MSDFYLWSAESEPKASQSALHHQTENQPISAKRDEEDCFTQTVVEPERGWFMDQTCVFSEVVKHLWTSKFGEGWIKITWKGYCAI